MARLDDIAADYVGVLHRTLREDPTAFGLYGAARAGGERLTAGMPSIWELSENGEEFVTRFTRAVGGDGGTMADAAVRRATASSARKLVQALDQQSQAGAPPRPGGLSGDLFCMVYQWFFADVVAEFLRSAIAEKVKLVVPLLPAVDPEDHIADWVAEHVVGLLPNPCEEAAELQEAVDTAQAVASTAEEPLGALRLAAERLVPQTAGRALGLLTDPADSEGGTTADTSHRGEPAA
ncbi:hypothetical protein ACIRO1_34175 [Streptomyces sp. NPDC102381]|uniref:hypothetical protein n=1 Tax=Streptomyces sp. NPDC102381 TaxID=3366164 RepID=UPI00381549A7